MKNQELKAAMQSKAMECFTTHKKAFEKWQYGDIKKIWFDNDYNLCIEYESGDWFHYKENGEWF